MEPAFNHPPAVREFWRALLQPLAGRRPTPFYLFSVVPIQEALAELGHHFGHLPVRHWLSCKTQPLRPLLRWWRQQGLGIEVVSEFEFLAALAEGFPPERILLNGPAKHHWLRRHPVRGLCVNFDSVREATALAPLAGKLNWTVGVRLNTQEEYDPESPEYPTQFGMVAEELVETLRVLKRSSVVPQIVHFHLRTNVSSPASYERALMEVAEICHACRWTPKYVDCGGGFPPRHVLTRDGHLLAAGAIGTKLNKRQRQGTSRPNPCGFDLTEMARVYERALARFPGAQEIWLENGRWLSARSGALVVRILDVKERRGLRHLICDGGRTLNALIANWESHELLTLPERTGPTCLTTVTGPTCMAFDQLVRRPLSRRLCAGDYLIWLEAGAYHLPWETRFSHGWAAAYWHDGRRIKLVRAREDFAHWWGEWR